MTRGMSSGHIWQLKLQRNVSSTVIESGANALPSMNVYGTQYWSTFRCARFTPSWRSCFLTVFLTTSMAMGTVSLDDRSRSGDGPAARFQVPDVVARGERVIRPLRGVVGGGGDAAPLEPVEHLAQHIG